MVHVKVTREESNRPFATNNYDIMSQKYTHSINNNQFIEFIFIVLFLAIYCGIKAIDVSHRWCYGHAFTFPRYWMVYQSKYTTYLSMSTHTHNERNALHIEMELITRLSQIQSIRTHSWNEINRLFLGRALSIENTFTAYVLDFKLDWCVGISHTFSRLLSMRMMRVVCTEKGAHWI